MNVLQFANDNFETEQYMKQNKLTLNEKKTEIMVFKNEKFSARYCVNFKCYSLKPTSERRKLDVIVISVKWLELSDQFK